VPIKKLLVDASLGVAGLSALIALFALVHEFLEVSGGPHQLMHALEQWVLGIGYHVALILLATAGVLYLTRKS
jgi:hypothetical protein